MKNYFKPLTLTLAVIFIAINITGIMLIVREQKKQTRLAQIEATIALEKMNYEQQLEITKAVSDALTLETNIRGLNEAWEKWHTSIKEEIAQD